MDSQKLSATQAPSLQQEQTVNVQQAKQPKSQSFTPSSSPLPTTSSRKTEQLQQWLSLQLPTGFLQELSSYQAVHARSNQISRSRITPARRQICISCKPLLPQNVWWVSYCRHPNRPMGIYARRPQPRGRNQKTSTTTWHQLVQPAQHTATDTNVRRQCWSSQNR